MKLKICGNHRRIRSPRLPHSRGSNSSIHAPECYIPRPLGTVRKQPKGRWGRRFKSTPRNPFFADRIPAFELVWNALHTFIRVPVAALLAWRATATLTPGEQLAIRLFGGLIALATHGGKTAACVAVTLSPEPFSNIGLSLDTETSAVVRQRRL